MVATTADPPRSCQAESVPGPEAQHARHILAVLVLAIGKQHRSPLLEGSVKHIHTLSGISFHVVEATPKLPAYIEWRARNED